MTLPNKAPEPQVVTFGCRLNSVESEAILSHAKSAGLNDCAVINTWAVTGEAAPQADRTDVKERANRLRDKARQSLGLYLDSVAHKDVEVLIENGSIGRTPHFAEVVVGAEPHVGHIRLVRTRYHDGRRLTGEIIS